MKQLNILIIKTIQVWQNSNRLCSGKVLYVYNSFHNLYMGKLFILKRVSGMYFYSLRDSDFGGLK